MIQHVMIQRVMIQRVMIQRVTTECGGVQQHECGTSAIARASALATPRCASSS